MMATRYEVVDEFEVLPLSGSGLGVAGAPRYSSFMCVSVENLALVLRLDPRLVTPAAGDIDVRP
ncbi:MAG: hypothetical protein OXC09_03270 [Truepera sp.]|nr:hypothetical protein [Truepera sp.]